MVYVAQPQEGVLSPYTSLVYMTAAEIWPNFLFGGFSIGYNGRTLSKNPYEYVSEAWSEHHLFQI